MVNTFVANPTRLPSSDSSSGVDSVDDFEEPSTVVFSFSKESRDYIELKSAATLQTQLRKSPAAKGGKPLKISIPETPHSYK
jgi:hypothetical protein